MTYNQAQAILKYCSVNGLAKPTISRRSGSDDHWLMWYESYDIRYFSEKGAKHFVRSLEYEQKYNHS